MSKAMAVCPSWESKRDLMQEHQEARMEIKVFDPGEELLQSCPIPGVAFSARLAGMRCLQRQDGSA
jgi:hypothetical protein